jgi:hypothetical protein
MMMVKLIVLKEKREDKNKNIRKLTITKLTITTTRNQMKKPKTQSN